MNASQKNILVTGGAGYIGSHTVVSLINQGFTPVILDDFRNARPDVIVRLEEVVGTKLAVANFSCQDEQKLDLLFQKFNFWGVIHFAADKAVGESVNNPLKYFENNIGGLTSILKVMRKHEVNQLVFSSSCTVYGDPTVIPVTEASPLSYSSPYGFTKLTNEQMIQQTVIAHPTLKVVLLRYFNPIGAHSSGLIGEEPSGVPTNLLPYLTQTAIGERALLTVFGDDYNTPDGTCVRDYIHVVDLADAHVQALNYLADHSNSENPAVFNIGTGKGTSVKQMINCFLTECNVSLPWTVGPRRTGDVPQIYADVTKAKKELGWVAKLSVNEAIISAWNYELKRVERLKNITS